MSRARAAFALLFTIALWVPNFGLIDLIDGFTGFVDQSRNQILDAGWGAVFGIVLPLGLLAQVRGPRFRIAGLQQTGVVVAALAVAAAAAAEWRYLVLVAALAAALALLLALHPGRGELLRGPRSFKPVLALAGVVAAIPCLVYAARMSSAQRRGLPPFDAVTNGLHHWTAMAALGLTVASLVLLAALGTPGWELPAWSAALAAAAWGVSCLSAPGPSPAGGEGRGWAVAAIAWAIAVPAAVRFEARRERRAAAREYAGGCEVLSGGPESRPARTGDGSRNATRRASARRA